MDDVLRQLRGHGFTPGYLAAQASIPLAYLLCVRPFNAGSRLQAASSFLPGFTQETDMLFVTIALGFHAWRKSRDHVTAALTLCTYIQACVNVIALMTSRPAAAFMLCITAAVWLTVREAAVPVDEAAVSVFTSAELAYVHAAATAAASKTGAQRGKDVKPATTPRTGWLVLFTEHAQEHMRATFSALAREYDVPGLRYACVDLRACPEASVSEGIDTSLLSQQTPCILLYDTSGKRGAHDCIVARLSPSQAVKVTDAPGDAPRSSLNLKMDAKDIVTFFALDSRAGPLAAL